MAKSSLSLFSCCKYDMRTLFLIVNDNLCNMSKFYWLPYVDLCLAVLRFPFHQDFFNTAVVCFFFF